VANCTCGHGAPHALHHLQGVKQLDRLRWIARCPLHPDPDPSLAIDVRPDSVGRWATFIVCTSRRCGDARAVCEKLGIPYGDTLYNNAELIERVRQTRTTPETLPDHLTLREERALLRPGRRPQDARARRPHRTVGQVLVSRPPGRRMGAARRRRVRCAQRPRQRDRASGHDVCGRARLAERSHEATRWAQGGDRTGR
jgi:hypothetical protein